ncbi:hypothetical protein Acsp04_63750 [Actinomadura sp. NBRC 104425]|uniref:hypothetical protein n=1 Tax=Actinomadura sp. NBRC 104425 TaxID=3032204 RepID=UPI0024A55FE3|nr:hypothetical protein [Actinomadura sp. NBRC 104425]GLZ16140.1 hypothetical protein Acsp04_63750 [Actinomadura sp. NBRC 104425]
MTSTQQIREAARRRRRRARLLVGVVAALAAVLVVSSLMSGSGGDGDAHGGPAPSSDGRSGSISPQGAVTLPGAAELLDERFPVRFPHTPQGAAAAMAAMLNASWTLDADHNLRAADIYAQPQIRERAREAAVPSARGMREHIGLPPDGPLPNEAYVRVTPIGVRWKVITPDQIRVAMMVNVTAAASAQATPQSQVVALGSDWVWDPSVRGGDWVWTLDDVSEFVPQIADPGTQRFTSLGWLPVAS